MNVTSNAATLVRQVLTGEVWPPLGDRHVYRTGPDGQAFALPGMGGMTLGVHCGDPATGYAADHLEPGASVRHRDPRANMALQFLTCVGNAVRVESGPAAGAVGHVIGQHAYVLVDFAAPVAEQVSTGDAVTVTAVGQGLALPGHPGIVVKNCAPGLLAAMPGGTRPDGRARTRASARICPWAWRGCASVTSWRSPTPTTGSAAARAAGARGAVIGKRGEDGRLITGFRQEDLARMRPGDEVTVRASGQGWRHPDVPPEVVAMNMAPGLPGTLPLSWPGHGPMTAGVRVVLPSKLAGNGIGRPAAAWDLELQTGAGPDGADGLLLGDLVAVTGLDARHNMGYRSGWLTVGVVVHGASPLPGHGPGITPILTGPISALSAVADPTGHRGLTESGLRLQ